MIDRLERLDSVTRLQYGLMMIVGSVCLIAAVAPLTYELKVAAVSVTFGFTVGLWVSHLISAMFTPSSNVAVGE